MGSIEYPNATHRESTSTNGLTLQVGSILIFILEFEEFEGDPWSPMPIPMPIPMPVPMSMLGIYLDYTG